MSVAEATFALVKEMHGNTAELAKGRETVEKLVKTLEGILGSLEQKAYVAQTAPGQTGALKSRDTTPAPRAMNWRPFKTGTPGGWIYTNENEPLRDTLLAAKNTGQETVVLEGHTYRLSGDEDQFIQRFPARSKK